MTDPFVTVLVVKHADGISYEGAKHQRAEALRELMDAGFEVAGFTTGVGDPVVGAWGAVQGFWTVP